MNVKNQQVFICALLAVGGMDASTTLSGLSSSERSVTISVASSADLAEFLHVYWSVCFESFLPIYRNYAEYLLGQDSEKILQEAAIVHGVPRYTKVLAGEEPRKKAIIARDAASNRLLGFLVAEVDDQDSTIVEYDLIGVEQDARGSGVGTLLLDAGETLFPNTRMVRLGAFKRGNEAVLKFYHSRGFQQTEYSWSPTPAYQGVPFTELFTGFVRETRRVKLDHRIDDEIEK